MPPAAQPSPARGAATIGHGQLGLASALRTFPDIVSLSSDGARRSFLEYRLGLALSTWAASGSNWTRTVTAAELTFGGIIRPIVGASSLIFPRELVRVERTADLVAGTWFFDDDALAAGGSATMTVRLPTATDPDDLGAGLVVHLLFCSCGGDGRGDAEVHPLLGDNKFLNSGFETWGGGNPTSWTEVGAGAVQETSIVLDGLSSAKIGSAAIAGSAFDGVEEAKVGVQGATYRLSCYYQTPISGQAPEVEVRVRVGDGTNYMLSDGRGTTTATDGFRIADTNGETKRYIFDFVWTKATTAALQAGIFLVNTNAGAKAGLLYVDRMSLRRIHRWNLYQPNLSASAIPDLTIQSQSILFGTKTIGFGSVTMLDGDGALTKAFASLLPLQKPAQVYVGGSFRNGEEIHREDWRGVFPALIRKPEFTPGQITLELEDARTVTLAKAPENAYRVADLATMSRSQENQPKPLMFGTPWDTGGATFQHIVPGVRVALNGSTAYGEYEDIDPTVPVRDAVDRDLPASYSIKVFPNKDLADRNLQGYVITDSVNDFNVTNNKTRYRVLRDIRNYRYDKAGDDVGTKASFPFLHAPGAGFPTTYYAEFNAEGPAYLVASTLQAAMRAAMGVATITVTYSETTHKFTVTWTGAAGDTFSLLMTTGGGSPARSAHRESWKLICGFDNRTDKTLALTYTSDNATFTDADVDHIIRFPGGGYRDDATGSICGVANVAIDSWPAAASWLLQKRHNVPASLIDVPSFADARDRSRSTDFAVIFGTFEADQTNDLLAIAERVSVANIVPDGDGVWHCIKHSAGTAGAREFFDADYVEGSWSMWLDPEAIYKNVRIQGDWNPSLKRFMTTGDGIGVLDPYIPIKHVEERILDIPSFIERQYIVGTTQQIGNHYSRLIGRVPRVVAFESRSKLVDLLPGYKVILNRTGPGVLDPTGSLTAVGFRILNLTKRLTTTGVTRCVAAEDVTFLS